MSSMISAMYQDTLTNLYAGVVSAIDREVLSYSPLPSNIVDPYASQDVDPAGTMNMTYSAMVVWIDEAKKADYFSKHFVTLSRMIMNGTTTMARGLVTMYGRGEDLSSAPMSIGDLISLSSYHFRKSYLGVIQTAKSKPEVSERLLLNQLGCLDTPTSGEYYLDGVSVRTMRRSQRARLRNRKIGFVFQNYNLLAKTTAVENVELPLMYNKAYNARQRREAAVGALQAVGLGDRLDHKSNQMSGGQMQRVAIARALVNNPAVILADEATGNLDTRTSFEILCLFQELHRQGRTIIFVTHNPDIAQYSSRNIMLRDGKIREDKENANILDAREALAALPTNNDD